MDESDPRRVKYAKTFTSPEAWEAYKAKYPGARKKRHNFEIEGEPPQKAEPRKKRPSKEEGEGTSEEIKPTKDEVKSPTEDTSEKLPNEISTEIGSKEEKQNLNVQKTNAVAKLKEALKSGKDKVQNISDKIMGKGRAGSSPNTIGDVAEAMAALFSVIFIPDQGGDQFLKSVQERLQTKDSENKKVLNAIQTLKAAESYALANPQADSTFENEGLDLVSDKDREKYQKVAEVFKGKVPDLAEKEDIQKSLVDYLTDMDDNRLKYLNTFVNDEGIFDEENFMGQWKKELNQKNKKTPKKK